MGRHQEDSESSYGGKDRGKDKSVDSDGRRGKSRHRRSKPGCREDSSVETPKPSRSRKATDRHRVPDEEVLSSADLAEDEQKLRRRQKHRQQLSGRLSDDASSRSYKKTRRKHRSGRYRRRHRDSSQASLESQEKSVSTSSSDHRSKKKKSKKKSRHRESSSSSSSSQPRRRNRKKHSKHRLSRSSSGESDRRSAARPAEKGPTGPGMGIRGGEEHDYNAAGENAAPAADDRPKLVLGDMINMSMKFSCNEARKHRERGNRGAEDKDNLLPENYDLLPGPEEGPVNLGVPDLTIHRGNNIPKPLKSFSELDGSLPLFVSELIEEKGWLPTSIQSVAIPALLSGKSIFAIAPTGTGKTHAFLIPIITRAMRTKRQMQSFNRTPLPKMLALILVPTRELALQIWQIAVEFARKSVVLKGRKQTGEPLDQRFWDKEELLEGNGSFCELTVAKLIGGEATELSSHQIGTKTLRLAEGDIGVATPGRLMETLFRRRLNLDRMETIVLDEFDDLLQCDQVNQIIENLVLRTRDEKRKFALFSATYPMDVIQKASRLVGPNSIHFDVGSESVEIMRLRKHEILICENEDEVYNTRLVVKLQEIREMSEAGDRVKILCFVNTKANLRYLQDDIRLEDQLEKVLFMHAELEWTDRCSKMSQFRDEGGILVATDLLQRGIHVDHMDVVVNVDFPLNFDGYIHRAGRAGHSGADEALVVSFMTVESVQRHGRVLMKFLYIAGREEDIPDELKELALTDVIQEVKSERAEMAKIFGDTLTAVDYLQEAEEKMKASSWTTGDASAQNNENPSTGNENPSTWNGNSWNEAKGNWNPAGQSDQGSSNWNNTQDSNRETAKDSTWENAQESNWGAPESNWGNAQGDSWENA